MRRSPHETFVRRFLHFKELDSTNTYAVQNATAIVEMPTLIIADRQIAGRGRGTHQWWAGDGALTFSLVLEPHELGLRKEQWPIMSLVTGLAVQTALANWAKHRHDDAAAQRVTEFQLKWPNDVYANGKKICGILIETIPSQPQRVVIGIGINVNNSFAHAPIDISQRGTALVDLLDASQDTEGVLIATLQQLEADLRLAASSSAELVQRWQQVCYLTGKQITVSEASSELRGRCLGIADDGRLLLQTAQGVKRCISGTVDSIGD